MRLYHGTIDTCAENILCNGILLEKGKPRVDFGKGFYTTPNEAFAWSTAVNKMCKTNLHQGAGYCKAAVVAYELNEEFMRSTGLRTIDFSEHDIDWAQFVINNRNGWEYFSKVKSGLHNLNKNYDVVSGCIADHTIVNTAKRLSILKKSISQKELDNIVYQYDTKQISFHTSKALHCLTFLGCDIIE